MHELCAIWIPDIYFSKSNKFIDLEKGIKAANRNMCSLCGELGAGLGCSHIDENGSFCKRHYHYRCMLNDRATPDWTTYKMYSSPNTLIFIIYIPFIDSITFLPLILYFHLIS